MAHSSIQSIKRSNDCVQTADKAHKHKNSNRKHKTVGFFASCVGKTGSLRFFTPAGKSRAKPARIVKFMVANLPDLW